VGAPRSFSTFAPMAIAAIGAASALPLLSRSIPIRLQSHDGTHKLRRLDITAPDPAIDEIYRRIVVWAHIVELNTDPEMPAELRNRMADNWRPLISIAEACGDQSNWRMSARAAAAIFAADYHDEDAAVILLNDVHDVFDAKGTDRIWSKDLAAELHAIDDGLWCEWRGVAGDQQPRKILQGQIAAMLRPFNIRPRTVWPFGRRPDTKSQKGYFRRDFEAAWAAYCSETGTPSQPSNIKYLRDA
jgi:Protein of unknown function (DUF3631)